MIQLIYVRFTNALRLQFSLEEYNVFIKLNLIW